MTGNEDNLSVVPSERLPHQIFHISEWRTDAYRWAEKERGAGYADRVEEPKL
jgi:hypothetical protein